MALRIACLLLSLLVYVPLCAAQSGDGLLLDSFDIESGATIDLGSDGDLLLDCNPVDLQLIEKIDDLFRDRGTLASGVEQEFPFSPRLVRQRNYGTLNVDASPRTVHFVISDNLIDDGVLLESNNGILRAVPPVPFRGAFIVRTSGTADGSELEFVIGDNGDGTLQAVPANTGILVVEHCEEGLCDLPAECADDEPIDVVLADDEPADDCGSPAPASGEPANGVRITGDADCLHLLPLPASDLTGDFAPSLNISNVFMDLAGTVMMVSPESTCAPGVSCIPSARAAETPPPPAPLPTRTVAGLLAPEEMPPEPEAIAAASGLSPFGFIETENGRPLPVAIEACQQAEPPLKAKVEHLLEAARHLAGAGYEEEAKIFRVEAEAIQNASHRLLAEKRQELERLQREIAELEALTGQYAMIQIDCRVMEFCVPDDCEVDADLSSLLQTSSCAQLPFGGPPSLIQRCAAGPTSQLLSGDDLNRLLDAIGSHPCGTLKTLAEPRIVTTSGRPATLRSGGEFPVTFPVTAEAGEPSAEIRWRHTGLSLQALPFVIGNDKVRLRLEAELSDRDFSTAVNLNGHVVPGLRIRRFNNEVEARFGETIALAGNSMRTDEGVKSLVLLVTVRQVEPVVAEAEHD